MTQRKKTYLSNKDKMVKENKASQYGLLDFENDFNLGKISSNGFILIVKSDKKYF